MDNNRISDSQTPESRAKSSSFDNLNLQRSYISLNSQNGPLTEVLTNFTINQYAQWCKMLTDFKEDYYGFNSLIGGSQVNQATFRTLFPIFAFDLRKQADGVSSNTVNMTVQFYFHGAIPPDTLAYAAIISDRLFKLDSIKNCQYYSGQFYVF